jgi:Flp pilus assembly protein TadD
VRSLYRVESTFSAGILGLAQERLGDFDESAAAFQLAIHLSPQRPRMHATRGAFWRSCAG